MAKTRTVWTFAILVFAACAPASGQDEGQSAALQQPTESFDEEVTVRGMQLGTLRDLIEEAELALFDRFNEINSDDQFDIYCYRRVELGSKMPHRRCLPNYWREAEMRIGEETARRLQGSSSLNSQMFVTEQSYKGQLLVEEMRRLTVEDEELLAAAARLENLRQTLVDGKEIRQAARLTSAREVSPENDEVAIDSGAGAVFEVRVGRKPWRHELTRRTFTIARVYGEIGDLEVECDAGSAKLKHEEGVEWTLPESWGACTVIVDARRDTTFGLYEFD
jgi:hypothetical protein